MQNGAVVFTKLDMERCEGLAKILISDSVQFSLTAKEWLELHAQLAWLSNLAVKMKQPPQPPVTDVRTVVEPVKKKNK